MKAFSEFRKEFATNPSLCRHQHIYADTIVKMPIDDTFRFTGTCQICLKSMAGVVDSYTRFGSKKCADGTHMIIEFNGNFTCRRCSF